MHCPHCGSRKSLEWQLCACEFKCSNCGELFTITDLAEKGILNNKKPPTSEQNPKNAKESLHPQTCNTMV